RTEHLMALPDPCGMDGLSPEAGSVRTEDPANAFHVEEPGPPKVGEVLVDSEVAKADDAQVAQRTMQSRTQDTSTETIRVGVNRLDRLMNLVGELVLARNQLLQFSNSTQDAGFQTVSQRMNLIA